MALNTFKCRPNYLTPLHFKGLILIATLLYSQGLKTLLKEFIKKPSPVGFFWVFWVLGFTGFLAGFQSMSGNYSRHSVERIPLPSHTQSYKVS